MMMIEEREGEEEQLIENPRVFWIHGYVCDV